ncbi:MAG: hypothetical protein PVJ66_01675 [Gammaproteobacteria bacterium]|jgi:hypothetical protein
MYLQQKPIPGYWYSNLSGQLIQVRALVYSSGKRSRIVLEDISGKRESVDLEGWDGMDLVLHSPATGRDKDMARDS